MPSQRERLTDSEKQAIAEGIELGLTSGEIAERIGRPAGTVRMHRTRIRRKLTDSEKQAIADGLEAGLTFKEIASRIGCSVGAVRYYRDQGTPPDHRVRDCLCCGTPFWSTGPGNRMCGACGKQTESPFDMDCAVHEGTP